MNRPQRIILVAAVADNGVIGEAGGIPWHLPDDFAHFKRVTAGHVLVMGRATYDSIGRALPGRPNIVITRNLDWRAPGVEVADSFIDALELASVYDGDVAVIGGAQVYAAALPVADEQILTEVHLSPEGDTHYPDFDPDGWVEARREPRTGGAVSFDWVWWDRRSRRSQPNS